MNTIKCRIKTNDFSDAPGVGITPAEVILLRTVHDKHAGGCCIKNAKPSGVAMTEVGRKPKKIETKDHDGNDIVMKTTEPVERERTDAEEIARLRAKYQVRAKSGAPGSHICDDLFGGVGLAVKLPQTFDALPDQYKRGLKIEMPEVEATAAVETVAEAPAPEKSAREELLALTVVELKKNAEELGVEKFANMNKAQLVDAILAKAGYAEPATA